MDVAEAIDRRLVEAGTAERAAHESAYLKSDLVHYGTAVPAIRRIVKEELKAAGALDRAAVLGLVDELWATPVHERRMAAVVALAAGAKLMSFDDLGLVERLVREARTWALVDPLAVNVAAPLLDLDHDAADRLLDRWASDADFWVRRTVLLAHLPGLRTGDGDWGRFTRYADAMLEEREFFIRKAIGWVLRDTSRKRPGMVAAWMLPRAHRASGVTLREVVKYLDRADAAEVTRRHRSQLVDEP